MIKITKLYCSQCERQIIRFYTVYDGKIFCENDDCKCLKEYLLEKYAKEMEQLEVEPEYDMSKVDDDLDFLK